MFRMTVRPLGQHEFATYEIEKFVFNRPPKTLRAANSTVERFMAGNPKYAPLLLLPEGAWVIHLRDPDKLLEVLTGRFLVIRKPIPRHEKESSNLVDGGYYIRLPVESITADESTVTTDSNQPLRQLAKYVVDAKLATFHAQATVEHVQDALNRAEQQAAALGLCARDGD